MTSSQSGSIVSYSPDSLNPDIHKGTAQGYSIILADPPWAFNTYSDRGKGRSADRHYNTMTTADICRLPVADLAAENCALFLWAVNPRLPDAFEVIRAWGFTYKTVAFTWVKHGKDGLSFPMGTGFWTRANPELCLLAIRGKLKRVDAGVPNLLISPRREHSRKPDEVRRRIVRLLGDLPRIELFARQAAPGWDCWGNQVESNVELNGYRPHSVLRFPL